MPAERAFTNASDLLDGPQCLFAVDLTISASAAPDWVLKAPVTSFARRCLNVGAAAALLALTSPLMVVIALAVKLTSRGPVFFTQQRVGLNRRNGSRSVAACRRRSDAGGKPFTIYKFRTMNVKGTNGDQQVWAEPDDPRVTSLGRVLRKYRLDELPQLANVLRGDMNLVGPRPEQPNIFAHLRQEIDHYEERQRVRPGLTGWAQVNHHYGLSVDDVRKKIKLDLEYIQRQSVVEDLKIMARTVPVILLRRGAW